MTRKRWSKSIGERGRKVRLYEARPGGPIMRSVWIEGKEARRSLGHRDKDLAVRQAYELLASLHANEMAIEHETLTIGMLERLYLDSPTHKSKKPRTERLAGKKVLKRPLRSLWMRNSRRCHSMRCPNPMRRKRPAKRLLRYQMKR